MRDQRHSHRSCSWSTTVLATFAMALAAGSSCNSSAIEQQSNRPDPNAPLLTPPDPPPVTANPLKRAKLYVDPHSQAMLQANEMRRSDPATAAILDRIAGQPQAMWMGEWNSDIFLAVKYFVGSAVAKKAVAVMIAYNMPHRDAAASEAGVGESEGGLATQEAYQRWIRNFAAGIGNSPAIVVMEPDALAGITSLPTGLSDERYFLFNDAIKVLRQNRNTAVYIDAGHATWVSPEEIAERLRRAGVEHASGFALNTANYRTTEECLKYGHKISELIDGKHFIIDTSRNGAGPYLEAKNETESWSNPFGRKLGAAPTTETGAPMVDGFLWLKRPGESDGRFRGGPKAGDWWMEQALDLAR